MTAPKEPPGTREAFERAHGTLMTKREFVDAVGAAVREQRGYAAGKVGVAERAWLTYPMLIDKGLPRVQMRAFELTLSRKASRGSGVFPDEPDFYRVFAEFHAERLRQLDCVGVSRDSFLATADIARYHRLEACYISYPDQEPDRSTPADDTRCYLPHFAGKRVLLVAPFAKVLRSRATRKTYEAVWAKIGKRWFEPDAVEAIEFPYGFARTTQERYGSCIDLLTEVEGRMAERDFDVALIAAGALGIPLASAAASRGKVGISLGGALQVAFGVAGERWRVRDSWRHRYFTDAWIDVPERYRPEPGETDEDYW